MSQLWTCCPELIGWQASTLFLRHEAAAATTYVTSYVFECSVRVQAPKKLFRSRLIGDALGSVMKRIEVDRANSLMWVLYFQLLFCVKFSLEYCMMWTFLAFRSIYAAFSLYDKFAINISICPLHSLYSSSTYSRIWTLSGWLSARRRWSAPVRISSRCHLGPIHLPIRLDYTASFPNLCSSSH